MTNKTDTPASHHETVLKARLRGEIQAGIAASRDPANADLPDLFARTTTMYSPWYTRTCPDCRHKFREGDRVRLCPECGQAYHDDDQYNLHCWQDHFANGSVCREKRYDPIAEVWREGCSYRWPGTFPNQDEKNAGDASSARRVAEITGQFLQGLENVWTPFGEQAVREMSPDSPIVGRKCPWCRFRIRAGDRVVKCPCGDCDTFFHDDIFRHLTCWDKWNGSQGNDYCPTTGAKIDRSRAAETGGDNER